MSINSGGKPFNENFPVPNQNNSSNGFRENFSTIKFAVESLQNPSVGSASVFDVQGNNNSSGGFVLNLLYRADRGFVLPSVRPTTNHIGAICQENNELLFYNGTSWNSFVTLVNGGLVLGNITATNALNIEFAPTQPHHAVNVQWVESRLAGISAGIDPAMVTRIENLEQGLLDEADARSQQDNILLDSIGAANLRVTNVESALVATENQVVQFTQTINNRVDAVETLANDVQSQFSGIQSSVQDVVNTVDQLELNLDARFLTERQEQIANTTSVNDRVDSILSITIPNVETLISDEAAARILGDQHLSDEIAALRTQTQQSDQQISTNLSNLHSSVSNMLAIANDANSASSSVIADLVAVNQRIDAEITARQAGDQTEATNRITGINVAKSESVQRDNVLQANINTEATNRTTAISAAISQEVTDRNAAIAAAINTEVTARDAAITAAINTEVTNRNTAISAEATARGAAITSAINTEVTNRNTAISAETTARGAAITSAINTEVTNRNSAISSAVSAETTARGTAITSAINTEVTNRNSAIDAAVANYLHLTNGGNVTGAVNFRNTVRVQNGTTTNITLNTNGNITTNGTITAQGDIMTNGQIGMLSDRTVKKDIVRIADALERVKSLVGVTFVRTDADTASRQMGLIAQNVLETAPEATFQRNDGKLGVYYGNLIALVIESIKTLDDKLEDLKSKL